MGWMISKLFSRIRVSATGVHAHALTNAADGNQTSRKRVREDQDVRVDEDYHNADDVQKDNPPGKSRTIRADRNNSHSTRIYITAEDDV